MIKKKSGTLFIWVFAAAALFLAVPFLFQEDSSKKGKNPSDIDGTLPIVSSDNPLSKYVNRLAEFYGFKKKDSKKSLRNSFNIADNSDDEESALEAMAGGMASMFGSSKEAGANSGANGQDYDADDIEAIRAAYNRAAGISIENGTVQTRSGLELKPELEGYYLGNKFYKNGSYPSLKNKKEIENALSKFHKEAAAQQGLRAAYVRNPDGSLSVKYISADELNNRDRSLFASANNYDNGRYDNARIISRTASGPDSESSGASVSGSGRRNINTSIDDLNSVYSSVSGRLKEHSTPKKEEGKKEPESDNKHNHGNDLSKELLAASRMATYSVRDPERDSTPNFLDPEEISAYQDGSAAVLKFEGMGRVKTFEDLLSDYGVSGNYNLTPIVIKGPPSGTKPSEFKEYYEDFFKHVVNKEIAALQESSPNGKLRVFSAVAPTDPDVTKKENIFAGWPHAAYVDVDNDGQPKSYKFSEIFLDRTGVSNMFEVLGVSDRSLVDLKNRYLPLDEKRMENNKYIQLIGDNKNINAKLPKVIFYLGKTRTNGNVAVASPSSFLYVYAPQMAPDFVARNDSKKSFQEMTADSFIRNINAKNRNNIVIVNSEAVASTLRKANVKNVLVIDRDVLASGTPANVEEVVEKLNALYVDKVKSDADLRAAFERAMKEANEREKQK